MPTITFDTTKLDKIVDSKLAIKAAIERKGQNLDQVAFDGYAAKIDAIDASYNPDLAVIPGGIHYHDWDGDLPEPIAPITRSRTAAVFGGSIYLAGGYYFLKSTDGMTWSQEAVIPTLNRSSSGETGGNVTIQFVAANSTCMLRAMKTNEIERTTDGVNWSKISFPITGFSVYGEARSKSSTWVMVMSSGKAARSTNDGVTWTQLDAGLNSGLSTATMASVDVNPTTNTWVAVGDSGYAARSNDDGVTWSALTKGLNCGEPTTNFMNVRYVGFDGTNHIWIALGNSGYAARSTDDGVTWVAMARGLSSGSVFTNFASADVINGVIVACAYLSSSANIVMSSDYGATWTSKGYANRSFRNVLAFQSRFVVMGLNTVAVSFASSLGAFSLFDYGIKQPIRLSASAVPTPNGVYVYQSIFGLPANDLAVRDRGLFTRDGYTLRKSKANFIVSGSQMPMIGDAVMLQPSYENNTNKALVRWSEDGGETWLQKEVTFPVNNPIRIMVWQSRWFVISSPGYYYSDNQGDTWTTHLVSDFGPVTQMCYPIRVGSTLYAVSYGAPNTHHFMKSTDNGTTWVITSNNSSQPNQPKMWNSLQGFVCKIGSTLVVLFYDTSPGRVVVKRSIDDGVTWTDQVLTGMGWFQSTSGNAGWSAATDGTTICHVDVTTGYAYASNDAGFTWYEIPRSAGFAKYSSSRITSVTYHNNAWQFYIANQGMIVVKGDLVTAINNWTYWYPGYVNPV